MQPKKYLGQNFLKDQAVLEKIIQAAELKTDDNVIEIGPGTGALTEELIKKFQKGKLIAIEKDYQLASKLDFRFRGNDSVKIISEDILKINLPQLIKKNNFQNYKVVANIPYYITSPIIQLFLETKFPPKEMILMVQREVAERICALPGEMSLLATSVQYYARPELLFYVDKKSFWPIPEVDSAVIRITCNQQLTTDNRKEIGNFFRVVKIGFSAKRKTLANNLANGLKIKKEEIEKILEEIGLEKNVRAQELSVEAWKKLATKIYE